ncbi:hypothetical protein PISMIDRAFT_14565 [Pisolithus microcarpus 441]|uniref:Dynamin-type G domain-containing protein n=1 Tax=Pisolithus microcarpus 441 TaxID=765257 RepID=A0A0C9ZDZ9_9AGAM|nr:hypothetical protein PISMIDRAFT_14565 [Pisolithus microcarpus 441]
MSFTPGTSTDSEIATGVLSDSLTPMAASDSPTPPLRVSDVQCRLRNTAVQRDIDLPMIAFIGNQSAGKSSLIESISGITLPRSQGTCTRCPTECKLTQADTPWTCAVKLHFITDESGSPVKATNITFGDAIFNKAHVEERIRRAQLACETDLENQGAHHLAKQYDPKGKRTVAGVLTQPDRIPQGEEESWI